MIISNIFNALVTESGGKYPADDLSIQIALYFLIWCQVLRTVGLFALDDNQQVFFTYFGYLFLSTPTLLFSTYFCQLLQQKVS